MWRSRGGPGRRRRAIAGRSGTTQWQHFAWPRPHSALQVHACICSLGNFLAVACLEKCVPALPARRVDVCIVMHARRLGRPLPKLRSEFGPRPGPGLGRRRMVATSSACSAAPADVELGVSAGAWFGPLRSATSSATSEPGRPPRRRPVRWPLVRSPRGVETVRRPRL